MDPNVVLPWAQTIIAQAGPSERGQPSPCAGWTVDDVIRHIEDVLLQGSALLGSSGLPFLEALAGADLDAIVSSPIGRLSVGNLIEHVTLDMLVHGWDICVGAGIPIPFLDDQVWAAALTYAEEAVPLTGRGFMVGPAVPVSASASTIARLIAYMGREPQPHL